MTADAAIDEIKVESNVVGKTEVNLKGNFKSVAFFVIRSGPCVAVCSFR